ncbi:hypothetical protein DM860_015473 [Cuscuta australis]|uniref:Uncharacterized protein n=2 Tax=Cuscuta sect. Cleistogrammica TaxID=1824901 RepID=A0A328E6V5_9ASTE|nr:hypothetical protein DM860_015473 [Cuscuta australis]
MAYNYRLINPPPLVHSQHYRSPSISFSANEVLPVGHSLPDVGLPSGGHFRNPMDMREAFLREIEKESIREKIIAEEIARTRFLNAEIRMEEEWALQRGENAKLLAKPFPCHHLSGAKRRVDTAAEPLKAISSNVSLKVKKGKAKKAVSVRALLK